MSVWRRKALEFLPAHRATIEKADNPMALWIELIGAFRQLHSAGLPADALVRPFYQFAHWCFFDSGSGATVNAVACAFYEHLPELPLVRAELPRWLSRSDFLACQQVFAYHLSEAEFAEFRDDFLARSPKLFARPSTTTTRNA